MSLRTDTGSVRTNPNTRSMLVREGEELTEELLGKGMVPTRSQSGQFENLNFDIRNPPLTDSMVGPDARTDTLLVVLVIANWLAMMT